MAEVGFFKSGLTIIGPVESYYQCSEVDVITCTVIIIEEEPTHESLQDGSLAKGLLGCMNEYLATDSSLGCMNEYLATDSSLCCMNEYLATDSSLCCMNEYLATDSSLCCMNEYLAIDSGGYR